jgi:hypothetical protein
MAVIGIDPSLQISEEIAEFLLFLLKEDRVPIPTPSLPEILLAKTRPGLNAEILTSSITSRFEEAGIPTGPLLGGTPNVMENFVKIMMEELVTAIQTDMRVDIAADAGATVQASGGNAGGPVVAVGSTIVPHTGVGIAS